MCEIAPKFIFLPDKNKSSLFKHIQKAYASCVFCALNAFVYLIAFLWARNDAFAIHHLFVHAF